MIRAVIDPGVLIAGLVSYSGAPARILDAWRGGRFDLVVCPMLLAEVRRALGYPRLARRVDPGDADAFIALLARQAIVVADPPSIPPVTRDPNDDYLFALAIGTSATVLVSGDADVLDVTDPPVATVTPRAFVDGLG